MKRISYLLLLLLHILLLTGCQGINNETNSIDSGNEKLDEYANVVESESNSKENSEQEQYSQETESQEYTNTSEADVTQEERKLLERINENKIDEQSFEIVLNNWGKVMFVSCMPDFDEDIDPLTDISFYLTDNKKVIYQFPDVAQDNVRESGLCEGVSFVFFEDINEDSRDDIVIGVLYISGAGPQGMIPYTEIRIYEDEVDTFIYNKELSEEINVNLPQDVTAEDVKKLYLIK